MEISKRITPAVIAAAAGLLQPYCPDLTPQGLIEAIKGHGGGNGDGIEKPLTRREAARILQCSFNTLNRYLNTGKLRRIRLTERSIRIDPESVRELLAGRGK